MSTQKSNQPFRHDTHGRELEKIHQLAKEKEAPSEVITSIERLLELMKCKDQFTLSHTSEDSAGSARLLAECYDHDWEGAHKQGKTSWHYVPRMVSGTLEGQFLKSFVSAHKAKKVLEIGMFTGFGALSMAEGLPDDGEVVTVDNCQYLGDVVQPLLDQYPHGKKVRIAIGEGEQVMKDLLDAGEKFDVVFLDAAKNQYEQYLKICFDENLLAPSGTVLVDNAYQGTGAYDPELPESVAKTFAAVVAKRQDLHKVTIPMRDGVYMLRRLSEVERH